MVLMYDMGDRQKTTNMPWQGETFRTVQIDHGAYPAPCTMSTGYTGRDVVLITTSVCLLAVG
jgi:hypothetical protein